MEKKYFKYQCKLSQLKKTLKMKGGANEYVVTECDMVYFKSNYSIFYNIFKNLYDKNKTIDNYIKYKNVIDSNKEIFTLPDEDQTNMQKSNAEEKDLNIKLLTLGTEGPGLTTIWSNLQRTGYEYFGKHIRRTLDKYKCTEQLVEKCKIYLNITNIIGKNIVYDYIEQTDKSAEEKYYYIENTIVLAAFNKYYFTELNGELDKIKNQRFDLDEFFNDIDIEKIELYNILLF
jgi:hypothetical protein